MRRIREKPSLVPMAWALLLLLAGSGALSRKEAAYLWIGRRTVARVDVSERIFTGQVGQKGRRVLQAVEFTYRDRDGTERHGSDFVTIFWEVPRAGGSVPIDYLPGRPDSARVAGNGPKLAPGLFVIACVSLVAVAVVAVVERRARVLREERRRQLEAEGEGEQEGD